MTSEHDPAVVARAVGDLPRLPGPPGLLLRGLTRRCAWCGDRKAYFVGWYRRQDTCRNCGHAFRRGDVGFEWGAVTANIILTFLVILISLGVTIAVTAPDVPVLPMMVIGGLFGLIGPVLLWPISFTLWQAVDLIMRPPSPAERAGHTATHL